MEKDKTDCVDVMLDIYKEWLEYTKYGYSRANNWSKPVEDVLQKDESLDKKEGD